MSDEDRNGTEPKPLGLLRKIGKRLTAIPEFDQVLQVTVKEATILAQAEIGVLFLLDRRKDELYLGWQQGLLDSELPSALAIDDYFAGKVVKTGQPQGFPPGDRPLKLWTKKLVSSALYLPMKLRGEVIGVLLVANPSGGRSFSETDERNLLDLTDYAAIAIQNTRMTQVLLEVSNLIGSTSDLKEITDRIFDELGKIVGYRKGSLQIIPGENLKRKLIACYGYDETKL